MASWPLQFVLTSDQAAKNAIHQTPRILNFLLLIVHELQHVNGMALKYHFC